MLASIEKHAERNELSMEDATAEMQLEFDRNWEPRDGRAQQEWFEDAQELLVPAGMGMINYNAAIFGTRPTKESIEGATIAEAEKVTTKAGSFTAKHIRFGAGSGNLDWWLTKEAPGGWVKFTGRSSSGDEKDTYTMELIGKGAGAKSELGVIK